MSKYRKALKNYTTQARTDKMISDIQQILVDFGASGIGFGYKDGRIDSINFQLVVNEQSRLISVPLMVGNVEEVLRQQGIKKKDPKEHAYRVALANTRDWLDAQLAYLATKQVEFAQLFLPYMTNTEGKTLYEVLKDNNFTLGYNE